MRVSWDWTVFIIALVLMIIGTEAGLYKSGYRYFCESIQSCKSDGSFQKLDDMIRGKAASSVVLLLGASFVTIVHGLSLKR